MAVRIIGLPELHGAMEKMLQNMNDTKIITRELEDEMRRHVHVITGYLKSSIYHKELVAGADSPYAGYEADRGGEHDYAEKAIQSFDIDKYVKHIVKPF